MRAKLIPSGFGFAGDFYACKQFSHFGSIQCVYGIVWRLQLRHCTYLPKDLNYLASIKIAKNLAPETVIVSRTQAGNKRNSKMATILIFFCWYSNKPFLPRSWAQNSKEHFNTNEARRANLNGYKIILKWHPFWNKVYQNGCFIL